MVNRIMKPSFMRIRPCNVVEEVHLLVKNKTSKSMPSSHAANFFAVATVFSYFYRKYQWIFWFLASLVAYSRVAVGVHYPFDILIGAFSGALFAAFWIYMFKKVIKIKGQTVV
ncbi:MAG: phosphatase PAP2 family protein [Calditrichaceae bacterium]